MSQNINKVIVATKPLAKSKSAWGSGLTLALLLKLLGAKYGIIDPTILPDVVDGILGIGGTVLNLWGLFSKKRAPIEGVIKQ